VTRSGAIRKEARIFGKVGDAEPEKTGGICSSVASLKLTAIATVHLWARHLGRSELLVLGVIFERNRDADSLLILAFPYSYVLRFSKFSNFWGCQFLGRGSEPPPKNKQECFDLFSFGLRGCLALDKTQVLSFNLPLTKNLKPMNWPRLPPSRFQSHSRVKTLGELAEPFRFLTFWNLSLP